MNQLFDRMLRAAKLEPAFYEEVEHDKTATGQALAAVALSSVAAGLGGGGLGLLGLIGGAFAALISWFLWSLVVYLVGTKLMPEPQTEADLGQLLRTIGFSSSPGVLRIFAFIPLLGWLIGTIAEIWMLVAMIIAVRQALDYQSTGRAVLVCVIGFVAAMIVQFLVLAPLFAGAALVSTM